ncbi:hypothetical protein pETSU_132 [Edwardsiella phage pEt-SU]|uniref:Uncharacterized protein n=1 Tax=Edwardsiella phage pEt-SU TaxID=2562142 RepID=A0A4D6DWK5_9CAUD|nr:hypothetical protein HOV39_gp132 [Edwardsiella phage pEt-SU]QBZ70713.1 hypothetical protein pETSU_132 [Edwardsiella phage pEt-SU]
MTTLKQQLAIDGQAISNLDKDMVITLDAHPSVQIDTIQEDSITYKFLGDITQDSTYTLNLTFVYKKLHKLVMPVTLSHVVNDPKIQVSWPTKSVKVWDEGTWGDIPFKVMFLGTDPAEDITASITNVVMISNEYITITDNTKWRVVNGNKTQSMNSTVDFTFDVEHGGVVYHCKGQVIFNIAQYDGIDYKVVLVGTAEGTLNTPSKLYFKPTYQGRFSPGTKISPTTGANIRVTINSQSDDLEKELLVVTITGTTVNDAIYNRIIFYKDGITTGTPTSFVMWFYIKIWAKAITVTGAPARTDTKYYQTYKFPITQIRLGHEIITPQDPRLVITGSSQASRAILGFDTDGIWMQNLFETVGSFVNAVTYIDSPGYAGWSLMTSSYTTEVGENLTLVPIQTSEITPSTHNDISVLVCRVDTEEEIPGLTLVGKPSIVSNGPKALIKYYDDIAISDSPAVGTLTLSTDNGHTGTGIMLSGAFKTPAGDILGLRNVQIVVPKAPMVGVTTGEVSVSKTEPVPVQFTLKQLQFDNVLTDVTTATFSDMVITGEGTAVGTITNKGNGLYEALVTPTAVTGTATITGTVSVNESGTAVTYPVEFAVQFNRVTDVEYIDAPLNVNVFQQGTDIPFQVKVEGVDVTSQMTDVVITPTTNIITSGGTNWEIWTAPTAGVAEKITYTFKVPGYNGELEEHSYVATFNIGAWDGLMLKVTKQDDLLFGSLVTNREFEVEVVYRGKAAADKVLMDPASVATWMTIVSQTPSEDNTKLKITFMGKSHPNAGKLNQWQGSTIPITGMKFTLTGSPGTTANVDYVTQPAQKGYFNGDFLSLYGYAGGLYGLTGEVTHYRADATAGAAMSVIYAVANGVRIPLEEMYFYSRTGFSTSAPNNVAQSMVYGQGTTIYSQISAAYSSTGYHNVLTAYWTKNSAYKFEPKNDGTSTDGNFWIRYSGTGSVAPTTLGGLDASAVSADDNELHFTFLQSGRTLTNPTAFIVKVIPIPGNGSAIVPDSPWSYIKDPADQNKVILDFAAGHTGDSIQLDGRITDAGMSGRWSRVTVTIPVPRSTVTFTPSATDIPAVGGQHLDIEFSLAMMHYKQTPADLSAIVFKSISVAGGADINGSVSHVGGNKFKVPVTISPSFGTVAISGIFTEPGSTVEYSFSGNVTTVNNSVVHVVGISPFNVAMFERDTRLPFTVNDTTGDITSTVKDVTITPNQYVITHGGSDWEIWSGPTAGGTTKVMYQFTVTSNGNDEVLTYEATFTLPAWDGKMLKIGYNYSDTDKKTVLGAIGASPVINTYTLYPIFRGKPAGDKVVYSTQTNSPSMTIVAGGPVESNAGYTINTNGPTGNATNHNQNSTIVYTLKPEFLNGQANNIEDVTQVTHAVRMRTYRTGGTSIYNLSNQTPYPKVGPNSAFRAILEIRSDKVIIPTDDPGITYNILAGNVSLFMSNLGVDQTSMYLFCTSIANNVGAFNNINATYNGSTSTAAAIYVEFSSGYAPLTWYNIVPVSGQTLDAAGNRQFKFTISEKGKSVVLLDKVVKGLKTTITPAIGNAVVAEPKGYTAVMGSDGVWTVNVGVGHSGDSFTVIGAIANASTPDVILAAPAPASPVAVTVKKAKGIVKLVGATRFEVKGTTKTDLIFTVDIPHYEGTVPMLGVFNSIALTGGAQTTMSNATLVSDNAWKVGNSSISGSGGDTTLTGKFYETGKSGIVYDLEPLTFQTVDVSKLYIKDIPTTGTVMQSSTVIPFECYVGNASGELLTPSSVKITGNTFIYGNNGNIWRPEPTIPLEGGVYQVQFDFVVTIDGVAENHTHMATINVSPWDGVEYTATPAGASTVYGLVGDSVAVTVDQAFRKVSVYQAGTWGSDAAYILAQSQGVVQWVSDATSSPANRPYVTFKGLKAGKFKFNAAVNYKGTNYNLWPVGTKDKNWQTYEIDVWIWDADIRFTSGTQPGPIAGAKGDSIIVPADFVYRDDSALPTYSGGLTITTSPSGIITPGTRLVNSWNAVINAANHGSDAVDVPVKIKYSYLANGVTYTMEYTQIFTIAGDGTNADVVAFTDVTDINTRNWGKGTLPFGVTVNGLTGTVKNVQVTTNDYIDAISTDSLNNVWQCKKGGVTGPVATQVEFVVVVNNGVRDYTVNKTINITIDKDDGSEFWIVPVAYNTDYDGLVAVKNNNVNNICSAQVYGYYRGDRVVTTATFSGLTSGFNSQSSAMATDGKWTYAFKHSNNAVQFNNLSIKLKYGTDAEVVGKNTATFVIPVFYYSTTLETPAQVIVSSPTTFTGKFGDVFTHTLNLADRGSAVQLNRPNVSPNFINFIPNAAASSVLGVLKPIAPRLMQYEFSADVQEETTTTIAYSVRLLNTVAKTTVVTLTFIQQPLHPKLPLVASQTSNIVGKFNDTGSMPMTLTYGGDITPTNDPKVTITADSGIQVTKTASGFDYKIILANTNPTGDYSSNITVTYEYTDGLFATTTFAQPIKFTATARDLVLTDSPINVKVWDIGTGVPFTLKAGTEDVTNLITDLEVTANTYVIQKASSVWQIVANAAISSIQVLTEFTYRLNDEALVRTGSGTFIIADYNGAEFTPYLENPFAGVVDGILMVSNNPDAGTNTDRGFKIVGVFRGEPTTIQAYGSPATVPNLSVTLPSGSGLALSYSAKATTSGYEGGGVIKVPVLLTGSSGNLPGINSATIDVPFAIYQTSAPSYVISAMTGTLSGTYGDELAVSCSVVNSGSVVDLSDPNVVIETTGGRVEVVPGSVTERGFKLRFVGQIASDVTGDQTVRIYNSVSPSLDTTGTISITQIGVDYVINVTQDTTIVVAAQNNLILFTLKDGEGNPITNATKVSLDVTENPKWRSVLAGYSNTLTNNSATTPGEYRLSMNLGQTAGTFTISLTVAVPGSTDSYKLTDMVFTNPGSPIKSALSVDTIDSTLDAVTPVTLTLTRDKYLTPNAPEAGNLRIVSVEGPAKAVTVSTVYNADGIFDLTVVGDGNVGEVTVNAEISPVVNDITWSAVPFSFKLNAEEAAAPAVTEQTTAMSLQLWEQKPIAFKVMVGDTDITSDASLTLNNDISSNLEFNAISEGVWGIKAISADSLEDVTLLVKVNVNVHYNGNDYVLPIEFNTTVVANTTGIPTNRFNIEFI